MLAVLDPHRAMYPWGHPTLVAAWLSAGVDASIPAVPDAPTGVAEAWFGTHPAGPTRTEAGTLLADAVAADGLAGLPWLVKLLAAATPLSIQVHPDGRTAADRFAHQHPSYVDAAGKPEALIAFCRTAAFVGVDSTVTARQRAEALAAPSLLDVLRTSAAHGAAALWLDPERAARCSSEVCTAVAANPSAFPTLAAVVERWCNDPAVAIAALLRPIVLEPGFGIEVPPGTVHAYVTGGGLEVMAASDNVLRGGLTTKPVDVDELLAVADLAAAPPAPRAVTSDFATDSLPCTIQRCTTTLVVNGPAIVWCARGTLVCAPVDASRPHIKVSAGRAVYVGQSSGPVVLKSSDAYVVASRAIRT